MKHGETIRRKILAAGVRLWAAGGESQVTLERVALACNLTHSGVLYHFKSAGRMRHAVACHAIETDESRVIVQLQAINHRALKRRKAS